MITIRKGSDRGLTQIDWLKSYHSFSFGDYYDPHHMGFGVLRVINEDTVQPAKGFGTHQHRDMEIISYVIDGALEHKDSMGTGSVIRPGEIQRMSAGSGVAHSEFNSSNQAVVHFLQIWIIPNSIGLPPSYEQKKLPQIRNELMLIGSPRGAEQAIVIHQDVELYNAKLDSSRSLKYQFQKGRNGWLQLVKGKLTINDTLIHSGDGVQMMDADEITLTALNEGAEFLLFDLK